jgi:hypothetical protein
LIIAAKQDDGNTQLIPTLTTTIIIVAGLFRLGDEQGQVWFGSDHIVAAGAMGDSPYWLITLRFGLGELFGEFGQFSGLSLHDL